jgi:hypothetical protein
MSDNSSDQLVVGSTDQAAAPVASAPADPSDARLDKTRRPHSSTRAPSPGRPARVPHGNLP